MSIPSTPASSPELPIAAEPAPRPSWARRVLVNPLLNLLKAGLSPAKLALTVGLGVAFGLAPTFGLTTIISTAAALRLRLNVAAMQLVCHLLSPVQVLLLLPLLRWGATLLGHGEAVANLNIKELRHMISADGWGVLQLLWRAEVGALLIWAVSAVPVVLGLYFLLLPIFRRIVARQEASETVAETIPE